MTPLNQTQYHLELILAIYNLIPYNKKVTAKQTNPSSARTVGINSFFAYYST
ncbi:hypothetical protein [Vibrio harveyi]|uniref:hypothetical protein n=1 Tax=Vibrio harveyi TaxID=669 RepID=UPI00217EE03D|nr:hypothetical protein [Vibrio harveyi]